MLNLNYNILSDATYFYSHNQEQIIFKTFFQRFILADKLLVDECVLPHNNIGKIMCKKSPRRCFNRDMVERFRFFSSKA